MERPPSTYICVLCLDLFERTGGRPRVPQKNVQDFERIVRCFGVEIGTTLKWSSDWDMELCGGCSTKLDGLEDALLTLKRCVSEVRDKVQLAQDKVERNEVVLPEKESSSGAGAGRRRMGTQLFEWEQLRAEMLTKFSKSLAALPEDRTEPQQRQLMDGVKCEGSTQSPTEQVPGTSSSLAFKRESSPEGLRMAEDDDAGTNPSQAVTVKGNRSSEVINHARKEGQTCSQKVNLKQQDKPFKCGKCSEKFRLKIEFKKHVARTHAAGDTAKTVKCKRTFSRGAGHRRHGVTGERRYKCALCSLSFETCTSIALHMQTHMPKRPHKCLDCEKDFSSSSALIKHRKSIHAARK